MIYMMSSQDGDVPLLAGVSGIAINLPI